MGRTVRHEATAVVAAVVAALLTTVAPAAPAHATGPAGDPWSPDPAVTAAIEGRDEEIADHRFAEDGARHVVLARADKFADALAGTPLLAEGPLLYVPTQGDAWWLPGKVGRFIPDGGRVYLLGGPAAISSDVESDLRERGFDVVRLAGADRVATSLAIATEVARLYPAGAQAVAVARAFGPPDDPDGSAAWADSVAAGGWAAATRHPIVLSPSDHLPANVARFLAGRKRAYLLGGTAALSEAVAKAVDAQVEQIGRVNGAGRSETAALVLRNLWRADPMSGRRIVIDGWSEHGWKAGLPAAGLSADHRAPVLLLHSQGVPLATAESAMHCGPAAIPVLAVGGINPYALQQLDRYDGLRCPPAQNPAPVSRADAITALYLVPSDRGVRLWLPDAARTELDLVNRWFAQQTGWKGLSWVRAGDGSYAVHTVRVAETAAKLNSNVAVRNVLDRLGYRGPAFVYVEATGYGCGSTQAGTAIIWMPQCGLYPDLSTPAFPFGASWITAHELTHLLGAVARCAPNHQDGHVVDSPEDILFPGMGSFEPVLDVGNDDYFRHDRSGCPDIADSVLWDR